MTLIDDRSCLERPIGSQTKGPLTAMLTTKVERFARNWREIGVCSDKPNNPQDKPAGFAKR